MKDKRRISLPTMDCSFVSKIFLFVAVWTFSVQAGCVPTEEGTDVTIDFLTGPPPCNRARTGWTEETTDDGYNLCEVGFFDNSLGTCVPEYNPYYDSRIERVGTNYKATLIFRKLKRGFENDYIWNVEGPWYLATRGCAGGDNITEACHKIELYVKPVNPTCELQVLSGSQTSIQVRCTTDRVFPEAKCLIYVSSNGGKVRNLNGDISYRHQPVGIDFKSECTLTVPVNSDLGDGKHTFHVNVYPDVTNGFNYGVNVSSEEVVFKSPSSAPTIAVNTISYGQKFDSEEGKNVNIACQVSDAYPPAKVALTCGQGGSHTATGAGSATLNGLTLTREMDRTKCVCTGTYEAGPYSNNTSELRLLISYKPQVSIAGGITDTFDGLKSDDLTVKEKTKVFLSCVGEGNPGPSISILREETELRSIKLDSRSGSLSHDILSAACNETGVYVCRASNSQGTSESRMNVFVECPFSRGATGSQDGDLPQMEETEDGDTMFDIKFQGYPDPTEFVLKKGSAQGHSGGRRKREAATAFDSLPAASLHFDKYVSRDESSPSHVTVKIVLLHPSTSDVGRYTMAVGNGIGQDLLIEFDVTESQVSKKRDTAALHGKDGGVDTKTAVIVIGAMSGVLGLLFVTSLIIFRLRRKSKEREQDLKGVENIYYETKDGGRLSTEK